MMVRFKEVYTKISYCKVDQKLYLKLKAPCALIIETGSVSVDTFFITTYYVTILDEMLRF